MVENRNIDRWAAGFSLGASALHGVAAPSHFEEWVGYGLFFLAASLAQAVLGLALLTDAVNPEDAGPGWARQKRLLYWAGILGNLAIMALYAVTRTTGIPFVGPEAGVVESIGAIDVASKVLEAVAVALLLVGLTRLQAQAARRTMD